MYEVLSRTLAVSLCVLVLGAGAVSGSYVRCASPATYTTGSNSISCFNSTSSASTSWSVGNPFDVSLSASASYTGSPTPWLGGGSAASADYGSDITFTFSAGTGSGYYMPCLSGFYDRRYGSLQAQFGSVWLPQPGPFAGTCSLTFSIWPGVAIPFVFGVPQTQRLTLHAGVDVGYGGLGSASARFSGFVVRDLDGQVIPNATWTVPEPRMAGPLLLAMLAFGLGHRLRVKRCRLDSPRVV